MEEILFMNPDIILKADELYFSYDDNNSHSLNGLSLKSDGDRSSLYGAKQAVENRLFFLCVPES